MSYTQRIQKVVVPASLDPENVDFAGVGEHDVGGVMGWGEKEGDGGGERGHQEEVWRHSKARC